MHTRGNDVTITLSTNNQTNIPVYLWWWTQSACQALGSPSLLQMLTDSHDSFHHGSGTSSISHATKVLVQDSTYVEHKIEAVTYCNNTSWNNFTFVMYYCPSLLSGQVTVIYPHPQVAEQSPKHPVQSMSLLVISRVGPQNPRRKSGRSSVTQGAHRQC